MSSEEVSKSGPRAPALEKQAEFLRSSVERALPCAIVGEDLLGRIESWSAGAKLVYGYDLCEVLGESGLMLHPRDEVDSGRAKADFERALAAGKWQGKARRLRKDGRSFLAEVTLMLRRDASGKRSGLVVVSRDPSELEAIKDDLESSRAAAAEMLDSVSHCLWHVDARGSVLHANANALRLAGANTSGKLDDVLGASARALLEETLAHDEINGFEVVVRTHDDSELRLPCDALALPASDGSDSSLLVALRIPARGTPHEAGETTGIRAVAPARILAELKKTRPESALGRPLLSARAELSHELRTPLNAILGFAELLSGGQAGPIGVDQREYLQDILASARHMLGVLNHELGSARASVTGISRATRVELSALVSEVRDALRLTAAAKRIDIELEASEPLSLSAEHSTRLRQILFNYLSNALKFTPEDGKVTVRCQTEGERLLRIEVEDSGRGIAPRDLDRLFREFEQLDPEATPEAQGSGLGLAITRRLAQALGGNVDVASREGMGSRFSVSLPLSELGAVLECAENTASSTLEAEAPAGNSASDRTLCA